MNSEDLKTIREALHDYAVLANHMNDEVCPSYGPDAQKAEEAIELFDAHVAALSQQIDAEYRRLAAELKQAVRQEAEPVGEVREWNKNGSGAFKELIGIDKLNDGDKLYLGPPKPAALQQPDRKFNECIHRVNFNSECAQCATESAAGLPPQQSDEEKWEPECGCRFENDHSSAVVLCDECRDLPCHNQGGIVPQEERIALLKSKIADLETKLQEYQLQEARQKPVPLDAEQFANAIAEWSQTQFEDVIRVSHFREFMRQRDAGSFERSNQSAGGPQ